MSLNLIQSLIEGSIPGDRTNKSLSQEELEFLVKESIAASHIKSMLNEKTYLFRGILRYTNDKPVLVSAATAPRTAVLGSFLLYWSAISPSWQRFPLRTLSTLTTTDKQHATNFAKGGKLFLAIPTESKALATLPTDFNLTKIKCHDGKVREVRTIMSHFFHLGIEPTKPIEVFLKNIEKEVLNPKFKTRSEEFDHLVNGIREHNSIMSYMEELLGPQAMNAKLITKAGKAYTSPQNETWFEGAHLLLPLSQTSDAMKVLERLL